MRFARKRGRDIRVAVRSVCVIKLPQIIVRKLSLHLSLYTERQEARHVVGRGLVSKPVHHGASPGLLLTVVPKRVDLLGDLLVDGGRCVYRAGIVGASLHRRFYGAQIILSVV